MNTPHWVVRILESRSTWLLARVVLTCPYWISGFMKLTHFSQAVAEMDQFGLRPPALIGASVISVQIVASALIVRGRLVWLAAGAIGVFTALATFRVHAFWTLQGHERFAAMNTFFEHLALIAGFVLCAMLAERRSCADRPTIEARQMAAHS